MPFFLYKKLDLVEMRPATISLQLIGHSVKYPIGILEEVLIKVEDLYVPIEFVMLEMEEDTRTSIILGRPLLTIAGCRTDVKTSKLSFDVDHRHMEFNLIKAFKFPSTFSECH